MSDELPEGWATVPFGALLTELRNGIPTRPSIEPPGTPLLRISAVRPGSVALDDFRFLPNAAALATTYALHDRDLLFTRYNGSLALLGVCGMVRGPGRRVLLYPDKLMRVRVDAQITSPEYIELFFQSPDARDAIMGIAKSSAGQQGISGANLRAQAVALPPLAEQRRIVEKVEALLARVNAARERLAKVPAILKRFRQSVLAAACSGRLTEDWRREQQGKKGADDTRDELPEGWRHVRLGDLLQPNGLFDGPFGSNLKTSDYTTSGVRVVRLENLANLRFVGEKMTFVSEEKYARLKKHTVFEDDILFGSFIDDAVRVCRLPKLGTPAIAKADCFCLRPRRDAVDRHYLVLQLGTSRTRDALIEQIHGATRPRITTKQLRDLDIPLCSFPEQDQIVRRVAALFALADAIERRVAAATARADKVTQAVLAKAFRGELVPTEAELARQEGRDYEPAAALLARLAIQRTHAASSREPKTSPRRNDRRARATTGSSGGRGSTRRARSKPRPLRTR